ncbi:WXG100 family type VII secretion target [Streptomyces sp. NPDC048258]|uniref:WXG100 family type VII secretion target n=1 Tax=Streptomyces sp. NPDC048258 TaxID=3365527 RepID=UPI00371FC48B
MAIELSDDLDELIGLQEAADEAHAEVKRLQEELGDAPQKWTDEQHVAWRDAWEDWREAGEQLDLALTDHAETIGLDRGDLETAVQKAAGHVPLPVEG